MIALRRFTLLTALLLGLPSFAGAATYLGQWNNTSFGSFGSIEIDLNTSATMFDMTVTLGGNVFGGPPPAPFMFSGPIGAGGDAAINIVGDPFFGDVMGSVTALGVVDIDMTNLPIPGTGQRIFSMSLDGTFDGIVADLDYLIIFNCDFMGGSQACPGPSMMGVERDHFALGTIDAALVIPVPPALAVFAPALAGLLGLGRRRQMMA